MQYAPKLKDGIEKIMGEIEDALKNVKFSNNINDKATLCHCFAVTIFSLIRCCYSCLAIRQKNGCNIFLRSLLEYAVDLKLIATSDSDTLSTIFVGYHKLQQYWKSKGFTEENKKEMPRIAAEYIDYINRHFREIMTEEASEYKKGKQYTYNKNIQEEIFDYWRVIDEKIKSKYSKSWSGLDFSSRVESLKKNIGNSDPSLGNIIVLFGYFSLSTHPTPYSIIPHFKPKSQEFKFQYGFSDNSLFEVEKAIFVILDSTIQDLIKSLNDTDRRNMFSIYSQALEKSEKLSNWIRELYYSED